MSTTLDPLQFEDSNDKQGVNEEICDDAIASEEEADSPRPATTTNYEGIGVISLAAIVFYSVSGGPFGVEESVRSAGNLWTLIGFGVMPLVWSLPEAMMTAELATAFPEASGGVAWVEEAFGFTAGWISGYLGWVSGATDNAIYPVLFLDYLLQVVSISSNEDEDEDEDVLNPWLRFLLLAFTSMALAYINWLGLPVVGRVSIIVSIVAMSPFVILILVGAFHIVPRRLFQTTDSVKWRPLLNNLFWNLNSFDSAASFSGDIADPVGRVIPRAMIWSVVLVALGYWVPLVVALGASNASPADWVDGYLAHVATDVAGPWLGAWLVFAAGISNIALFQAELSADAFQLMGMADRGHLPSIFSRRSRHGTPTYGILLGTFVIVIMGVSNLDELIEMLNFNYAISLLMEYLAFIKLRVTRPGLDRPWRVPLNTAACIVALIPTLSFTILVMGLATPATYLFSVIVNLFGVALFAIQHRHIDRVRQHQNRYTQAESSELSTEDSAIEDSRRPFAYT